MKTGDDMRHERNKAWAGDAFDERVARALRARPEPTAGIDLAAVALVRARAAQLSEERVARLLRLRRWTRVATFAAAALVVLTVAVGYHFLPTLSSDTVADTVTTTVNWTTVGIALFVAALIAVALAALFTPDRPQMRLTPT